MCSARPSLLRQTAASIQGANDPSPDDPSGALYDKDEPQNPSGPRASVRDAGDWGKAKRTGLVERGLNGLPAPGVESFEFAGHHPVMAGKSGGDPVELHSGAFVLSATDLAVRTRHAPIEVVRTYRSGAARRAAGTSVSTGISTGTSTFAFCATVASRGGPARCARWCSRARHAPANIYPSARSPACSKRPRPTVPGAFASPMGGACSFAGLLVGRTPSVCRW